MKCCKKKCSKVFCQECILLKFDKTFKSENVKADTWICYSCGEKCDCILCDPRGLKRGNPSNLNKKTSLRLRLSGKTKWYHEKNRGALKTIALEYVENPALSSFFQTQEQSEGQESCCESDKEIKRKSKKDLGKYEDKYLRRKKAVRECYQEEIHQKIEDKEAKINQILNEIDLGGGKEFFNMK